MELSEGYNKDTICRICLQPEPDLYPIFDPVKSQSTDTNFITPVTVAEILTECSKYKVTHDDKLPTNICLACLELARSAHSFKLQTEKSYRRLKALYDITWVSEEKDEGEGRLVNRYTQTEKSTIFQCESCTKKFFIESELRLHRTTCQILAKKCRVCGEIFNHLGQLKVHLSTEHPSEGIRCEYKCELCQREFARKDHMKRHVRKVHKIDDKLIVSKVSLDEPEIQIQNPTSLPTDLNNYSSHWPDYNEEEEEPDTTRNMEQNATVATNPFSSEDDDADFSNMDAEDVKNFAETLAQPEISIKVESIDIEDRYSYDDYEYVDGVKKQLGKYEEPELITPNYNGSVKRSRQSSIDDNEMFQHMLDYKEPVEKSNNLDCIVYTRNEVTNLYHCEQCPLEFKLLRNLRRHMLTHTDDRPFECEFCEKTFKRKDNLQKHFRDVHSEKYFACKPCEKSFATSGQLARHRQTNRHINLVAQTMSRIASHQPRRK